LPNDRYYVVLGEYAVEDRDETLTDWKGSYRALLDIGMPVDSYYLIKACAMSRLLYLMSNAKADFPSLDATMQYWVYRSAHGGYRYADNGFSGECYEYDMSSFYAWIMMNHKFPMGVPKFQTVRSIDRLGIYRLHSDDGAEYYDVLDVACGSVLKKNMKLALDGEVNALVWDRWIDGAKLFADYIRPLYDLKQKGHSLAKRFLNIPTGGLARRNWIAVEELQGRDCVDTRRRKSDGIFQGVPLDHIYVNATVCHLHTFITAYGRMFMRNIVEGLGDDIKYVHTDGFLSTAEIDLGGFNAGILSGAMGELVSKGHGHYKVEGSQKERLI
jgi:hypothetical protein